MSLLATLVHGALLSIELVDLHVLQLPLIQAPCLIFSLCPHSSPGKKTRKALSCFKVVHFNPLVRTPMAARVTIVDYRGHVVYDTLIRPTQPVCDYRTHFTGLRPLDLAGAPDFHSVQLQVAMHLRDKIVVGHALWNFLSVMGLSHPAIDTRDAALFLPFRKSLKYKPHVIIPLATLMQLLMNRQIGSHGEVAVEDARAAMDLFRSCEQTWESVIKSGAWPCALPPAAYGNCFT
ncbi:hypothetical protein BXZ70DRAFT_907203 [Cristinia sonorae]|uniref:Exonuclease domain-containing protein n=1 Tax=Cristinia sonorae TaxID=1940300 RepID=A0A8K0UP62_9AGAR|nr:hypothetical protein BXZ70DRAFT_907203 [Cristinia sonorae]